MASGTMMCYRKDFFSLLDYHIVRRFGMKCWKKCVRFEGVGESSILKEGKVNEISSLSSGDSSGGYESLENCLTGALLKGTQESQIFPTRSSFFRSSNVCLVCKVAFFCVVPKDCQVWRQQG